MSHTNESDHLDPTSEITLDTVKSKAVKGVAVLTGRTFLLNAVSLVATGYLTVFLQIEELGVFWLVSAVVNFLNYFSDIGLGAALIQKKTSITRDDLKTTFSVQMTMVTVIIVLLVAATPIIRAHYSLSQDAVYVMYALAASLFMSSLKTVPTILLERELDFGKLVIPQVFENLAYNLVAVFLAWKGFGVSSFTWAVLARGIVGLVGIYILRPWKPGIAFSKSSLRELLKFGVPYQANTFLATIKDDGMTAYLGGVLGTGGLGILGWAQKWAYMPLRLFMDHVLKVTFPAFSRMQDEKKHLERSVTRSIFFVCFLVFPSIVGLVLLAPVLIEIIPRYDKWRPALVPLAFISVNTLFAAATTQLTNLLNAIGKIKITFKLMVMWTILTWIFIPFLAKQYGVVGAAAGYSLVGASSIVPIFITRRFVKFSLYEGIGRPALATAAMAIVVYFARSFAGNTLTWVWLLAVLGAIVYMGVTYVLVGKEIVHDAKKGIRSAISKN